MATVPDVGGGADATAERAITRSLRIRQTSIVLCLFGGYAALYFCRADLAVATPLLIEELGKHGVSHADAIICMGSIT
jgi:sugar phosphate permease